MLPATELQIFVVHKLGSIPSAAQQQFLTLHNPFPGKDPLGNTFKANALQCGSGSPIGAVYPTICLINHSCDPNAHPSWNSEAEHETLHADRPIKVGEEITIGYVYEESSGVRRTSLHAAFGFDCTCAVCSLPASELANSDNRRTQIQTLDRSIANPLRLLTVPKKCLQDCKELLNLLQAEYSGAEVLKARVYFDAFQIAIMHGDQARAGLFAERSYRSWVLCEGEDSPDTRRVRQLASSPASHPSFELTSRKWKSTKKKTPKGLDAVTFEKWLFMQD